MSMSSSDMPSEKYSWSLFSLMSANGSTATDFSGTAKVRDGEGAEIGAGFFTASCVCFDSQILSTTNASATPTIRVLMIATRLSRLRGGLESAGGGATVEVAMRAESPFWALRIASISLGSARLLSPLLASSHWGVFRKNYS